MPGIDATAPNAGTDDLDRMLDDNFDVDALFDDIERDAQARGGISTAPAKEKRADLGIDEEIEVKKKRKPVPKLDENLLLTQNGIPKLQRLARQRLKFKGKGHEFSDISRMLNMYQLWLDDLYPRAKFADSIAMVEKAGHSKRMQIMRKEWINEGKPKDPFDTAEPIAPEPADHATTDAPMSGAVETLHTTESQTTAPLQREESPDLFLSDEEDVTTIKPPAKEPLAADADEPAEDELDALLAESETVTAPTKVPAQATASSRPPDEFADEMDAMADMEMW